MPRDDYKVEITFANGEVGVFDCARLLSFGVFQEHRQKSEDKERHFTVMEHFNWSGSEKQVARRAFDAALGREYGALLRKTREMAGAMQEGADLWRLQDFLTNKRREIGRKYDYRYSQLIVVFGRLVHEAGWAWRSWTACTKTSWRRSGRSCRWPRSSLVPAARTKRILRG